MQFRLINPIVVLVHGEGYKYKQFLRPGEEGYEEASLAKILKKHLAILSNDGEGALRNHKLDPKDIDFTILTERSYIRSKKYTIRGIDVKGLLYEFGIKAPRELIETGYYAGFGEENSALGMGMVEVI